MGEPRLQEPVLFVLVAFSQSRDALAWSLEQVVQQYGPVAFESEDFDFTQTSYYQASMGEKLVKKFYVFADLIDAGQLAQLKHETNQWEAACQEQFPDAACERIVNLDPGYLTQAKFVLATTKDREHRIYIGNGMFAEITLAFHHKQWQANPWTYPDFRTAGYQDFLTRARDFYRQHPKRFN